MSIVLHNNIYSNFGDNQYLLLKNEYIYEFKKYYFKNDIILRYQNNKYQINLQNELYFQIQTIDIGNYILLFVFNKNKLFFYQRIIKSNEHYYYNYDDLIFCKFKLNRLISILDNNLGNEIKLPEDIIFNIRDKLNIIKQDLNKLDKQKILYYIQYIKNTFHL